jgi:fucose permease
MWSDKQTTTAVDEPKRLTDYKTPMRETLRQPWVWLSALLFFLYVGAEVSFGTWTYSLLTESRGIAPAVAGLFAGSYWATFTVGRIVAGLFARRTGVNRLVQGGLLAALVGTILLAWNPSEQANVLAVALIGFAIAPIFPALMSGTSQRVGEHFAANTIGLQMTATGLGTAVIPSLLGILARRVSLEIIPICMAVVFMFLFGLYTVAIRHMATVRSFRHEQAGTPTSS